MVDRLGCRDHLVVQPERFSRIEIAAEPREVAAGNLHADPMPALPVSQRIGNSLGGVEQRHVLVLSET